MRILDILGFARKNFSRIWISDVTRGNNLSRIPRTVFESNKKRRPFVRKPQRDIHLLKMVGNFFFATESWFLDNGGLFYENGSLLYENGGLVYENGSLLYENGSLFYENGSLLYKNESLLYENERLFCENSSWFFQKWEFVL